MLFILAMTSSTFAATTQPSSPADLATQPLQNQITQLQEQLNRCRNQIESMKVDLRDRIHRTEISPPVIHAAAATFDDQIESLELQAASNSARHDAIAKAIRQTANGAVASADNDVLVGELRNVIDARKKQVDFVHKQFDAGLATSADVTKAEAEFSNAQADFESHRQGVIVAASGDAIAALNKELIDVQIAQADNSAKLQFLRQRLDQIASGFSELDSLEQAQAQKLEAEKELDECRQELREADLARIRTGQ
jgi:chromosome segregation ATPase